MVPQDSVFSDRARAESFGTVADEYDRYRPSYPDALISDLVALNPKRALDVACGTGKVATLLIACGVAVLGVEVDEKMAEVARRHGIIVEVGAFETWDDEGRRFDLVTCGQGWHWIDPVRGAHKAATVLRPGGTLALFWNDDTPDEPVRRALDAVYREHAPELLDATGAQRRPGDDDREPHVADLRSAGVFSRIEVRRYRWDRTSTADEWIGRAATQSDHIRLPADRRAALLEAVREVIDGQGGTIDTRFTTYTIYARTPE